MLNDERLRSAVVEFDGRLPDAFGIWDAFVDAGFEVSFDQLRITRDGLTDTEEVARLVADRRLITDVLFSRDPVYFDGARAVIERYLAPKYTK